MSLQYPKQHSPHHLKNTNTSKVPLGLEQTPTYFQELMTGVLKDFAFPITYLDDIIIFSKTAEHLKQIKKAFEKLQNTHLSMKPSKCHFFAKEIQYLRHILGTTGIRPLLSKTQAITCTYVKLHNMYAHSLDSLYRKFIKDFAKMIKPLTLLTHHRAKFKWTTCTIQPSWH